MCETLVHPLAHHHDSIRQANTVRLCTYNIQYGVGRDGVVDLARVASDIGDVDLACIQEVERFFPDTGNVDQVETIAGMFPEHHWVFTPGVDLDADERRPEGGIQRRRRRFGNMVLSKHRISSVRGHLLPKHHLTEQFSLQRVALDAVVALPSGPLRVITTHLAHASPVERSDQIRRLLDIVNRDDGGAWSGRAAPDHWTQTGAPPGDPSRTLVCGDFNLTPDSPEYQLLVGPTDVGHGRLATVDHLVDAWTATGTGHPPTCVEAPRGDRPRRSVCLDYLFLTPDIAGAATSIWVDQDARGSDHQPVFADLEL